MGSWLCQSVPQSYSLGRIVQRRSKGCAPLSRRHLFRISISSSYLAHASSFGRAIVPDLFHRKVYVQSIRADAILPYPGKLPRRRYCCGIKHRADLRAATAASGCLLETVDARRLIGSLLRGSVTHRPFDLRSLDRHRDAAVTSLIPSLSCRSCRPNAPFAEPIRLSRTRVADEKRIEQTRRLIGEYHSDETSALTPTADILSQRSKCGDRARKKYYLSLKISWKMTTMAATICVSF